MSALRTPAVLVAAAVAAALGAGPSAGAPEDVLDSQAYLERALAGSPPFRTEDVQRARDLVARMTLAEKAGQMTQLEIGMISDGKGTALKVNPEKLTHWNG